MAKETNGKVVEVFEGMNSDLVSTSDLNKLTSISEAIELLGLSGISAEERESFLQWDTNPWEPVEKEKLVGLTLFLAQWRFIAGSYGEFVVVNAFAELGNGTTWQVLFSDGSNGIYSQLKELTARRMKENHAFPQNGALVKGGLVRSDYEYTDAEGKTAPASTYYLSNRKKV